MPSRKSEIPSHISKIRVLCILHPNRLTIYGTEPDGPFKAGIYRAGEAEGEGVIVPLSTSEKPIHPGEVQNLIIYGTMEHRVASEGGDDSMFYLGN